MEPVLDQAASLLLEHYEKQIQSLLTTGRQLTINWSDIYDVSEDLGTRIITDPRPPLNLLADTAHQRLRNTQPEYAESMWDNILKTTKIHISIKGLPVETVIRKIDPEQMGQLIQISGITVKATTPKSILKDAVWVCQVCETENHVPQKIGFLTQPQKCYGCDGRKFYLRAEKCTSTSYQEIKIQELPEDLPPGQMPRAFKVKLEGDLTGKVNPGDRVTLIGILSQEMTSFASKSLLMDMFIDGNYIDLSDTKLGIVNLTEEDIETILELSRRPDLIPTLVDSIAPDIYGYYSIKEAMLYQQMEGVTLKRGAILSRGLIHILLVGDPGTGKALDVTTPIPTTEGWKTMENIHPGDLIFDEKGNPCNVVAESPIMYDHDVYEISFDDGSKIKADGDHQWKTSTRASRVSRARATKRDKHRLHDGRTQTEKRVRDSIKTTLKIKETLYREDASGKRNNHAIDLNQPLHLPKKELPIPPYVLGAWLGDGDNDNGGITGKDKEIMTEIRNQGYTVRRRPSGEYKYGILGLQKQLRENNFLHNKHIPQEYLRASYEQRLDLLQGLMDTDGSQADSSGSSFSNSETRLIDGVSELLCTLGIKNGGRERDLVLNGKDYGLFYEVMFTTTTPVFKLTRKLDLQPKITRKTVNKRYITNVKKIPSTPVKCIIVDSPSHLFLAGRSMIPTHNSQLLRYAASIAPRGIFTTGKGSSGVGLTATAVKEDDTWVLEAGSLVIADKGICCIDEIEKMNEVDQTAIHPAMEQLVVNIAKAGINKELPARTSILAAANPTFGRYNPYVPVAKNIEKLPVTLLSRFDLIYILKDEPDVEKDDKILDITLSDTSITPPINPETLRKYISYARTITPKLTPEATEIIRVFYHKMRKASIEGGEAAAIAITTRQSESLRRIAQARARCRLSDKVSPEDAEAAVSLMRDSLNQVGIDPDTGEYDIDTLYLGKPRSLQAKLQKALQVIGDMERVSGSVRDDDLYEALLSDHGIGRTEAARIIGVLMKDGTIFSPRPSYYKVIR